MLRHKIVVASQTQPLRGIGRRGDYPLLRASSTAPSLPPIDDENSRNISALPAQNKTKIPHARQSTHDGPYAALRSKVTLKRTLIAYIASALIVLYVYETLRDRGFFDEIADATIFRVMPPKLVEARDGAGETIFRPITQEKEIRLLILEPGAPGDDLKCRLFHAQLSWRTRYEALSYVWGDATSNRPLTCSGRTEVIHANLHDALSDLRLPDRERILWADRLCINQSDDAEKTAQIKLMGEIYSQASQVLIYLGKMDPSVEGAIEALRRVDSERGVFYSNKHLRPFYRLWNIITKDKIHSLMWKPIINMLRRPWFRRTWVFQEAVLVRHGQVICGTQSIPWTVFERSVLFMAVYKSLVEDMPAYESTDRAASVVSLNTSVRLARHTEWKAILPLLWLITGSQPRSQASLQLLDLILESRSLLCTNPEDKIFGMLGVTSQDIGSEYLARDSSLSPGEFFRNFVLWDIFHNDSLRSLTCTSGRQGGQYHWPSWVPDFERLDPQSTLTGNKNHDKFDACAGLPKKVWVSDEDTVLHVKGRIVDALHTVGKGCTTAPGPFTREFQSLSHLALNKQMVEEATDIWVAATRRFAYCREPVIMASVQKGYLATERPNGRFSWVPFLRTLVLNRTKEGTMPSKEFILRDVASFVRRTLELDVIPDYLLELQVDRSEEISGVEALLALTESRRFAATNVGLIGYVPKRAKKGDLVCMLYGSEVPFVVRKEAGGKYSLVGECYMNGIMNGEALKMAVIRDEDEIFSFI